MYIYIYIMTLHEVDTVSKSINITCTFSNTIYLDLNLLPPKVACLLLTARATRCRIVPCLNIILGGDIIQKTCGTKTPPPPSKPAPGG